MAKSRASRRVNKRNKRSMRKHRGGAHLSPADVGDESMFGPSSQSVSQGMDYMRIHQDQHGGAVSLASSAPVGDQGLLDSSLRASAHLGPLDASVAAASGMSDQSGGRRSKSRKSVMKMLKDTLKSTRNALKFKRNKSLHKMLKNTYRSTKSALSLKRFKKMLRMRGGAALQNAADYASPGTLLPPSMEAKALTGMNPEWSLDMRSFMPK
jgi:hypothetical protein